MSNEWWLGYGHGCNPRPYWSLNEPTTALDVNHSSADHRLVDWFTTSKANGFGVINSRFWLSRRNVAHRDDCYVRWSIVESALRQKYSAHRSTPIHASPYLHRYQKIGKRVKHELWKPYRTWCRSIRSSLWVVLLSPRCPYATDHCRKVWTMRTKRPLNRQWSAHTHWTVKGDGIHMNQPTIHSTIH